MIYSWFINLEGVRGLCKQLNPSETFTSWSITSKMLAQAVSCEGKHVQQEANIWSVRERFSIVTATAVSAPCWDVRIVNSLCVVVLFGFLLSPQSILILTKHTSIEGWVFFPHMDMNFFSSSLSCHYKLKLWEGVSCILLKIWIKTLQKKVYSHLPRLWTNLQSGWNTSSLFNRLIAALQNIAKGRRREGKDVQEPESTVASPGLKTFDWLNIVTGLHASGIWNTCYNTWKNLFSVPHCP